MNPYIDEATGTHFNKLGIRDRDTLHQIGDGVLDLVQRVPVASTSITSSRSMPISFKTCTSGRAKSAR